jgi:putative membrane protein
MLTKKSGTEFDRAYAQAVAGHEKMQQLLDHEAKNGKDADLKAFAEKALSTVEEHYQMEKELNAKIGE